MSEYIFEIDTTVGFNEKTGVIVPVPKYVGEIVRRKDCKYFTPQPDTIEACCDLTYSRALPDDYCSYAERKEAENDED